MEAVILILKHATLLQASHLPKAALVNADLDYQTQTIDESIQQYLAAHASDVSEEQFAGFIMHTKIGLFILLPLSLQYLIVLLVTSQSLATAQV